MYYILVKEFNAIGSVVYGSNDSKIALDYISLGDSEEVVISDKKFL
ncbi:hypothetical protein [Clostridium gasigenes]|uniref:Uncharacterized protein n=1 Tax=Clostridium gasigenes TaxID=94869 RepID=A0A7X0VR07_9CLOT|nr:hypothetical protein [Clostridium gasigenes]MBB6714869.1 hypothetical protein [Clostridium gasigenes]